MLRLRSVNEQLVREGLALTGPMDLDLFDDPKYMKQYARLLQAQEYAERKQLGMWKLTTDKKKGILRRLWEKMRSFGPKVT